MTADEWRLHDVLMVRFALVLFVLKQPEILSAETTEEQRRDMARQYIHSDPTAYHALRSLVHIAVEESKRSPQV